jgi:hypothetical protein
MKAGKRHAARALLLATALFCPCVGWSWEILGSLKDDAGKPIPGVTVSGYGRTDNTNGFVEAVTAEDGGFHLAAFNGTWSVWVDSRGLNLRGYRSASSLERLIVVSGADERVDFVCPKAAFTTRLSGRVIDEQGVPLTNAAISASELVYGFSARTTTGEAGRFDLPLFGGFWDLEMTAYRPGSAALFLPRIVLRVVDGVDQTNSLFVARIPSSEVVVSLQDASGSNISNLVSDGYLFAIATLGNTNYSTGTSLDSNGKFNLHLSEGAWRLLVEVLPLDSRVPIGIPDRTITVTGTHQDVSLAARNPTNHLRGHLVDNFGAPISDVMISAISFRNEARTAIRTGADGSFDLTLFAGLWDLSADRPVLDGPGAYLRDVAVIDGLDRTNVQLIAQRYTAEITGSLTDTSGSPAAGFYVGASATINGEVYSTSGRTDAQGKFRLPAFNAEWNVSVAPYQSVFNQNASRNGPARTVTVSGTNEIVELVVVEPLTLTSRLRGRVVDSAGAAVSGLRLFARSSDEVFGASTETGYGGAFELDVCGGSWVISAESFQDGKWGYLGPRISIEVQEGVNQTNLLLVAQRTTSQITGTVADTDGQGVDRLLLSASTDVQGTNYWVSGETDQEGRFRFDVMDASWEVQVADRWLNALGFQSLPARTSVVAGANEVLDIVARRIIGDGRALTFVAPIRLTDGALQLRATSQTAQRYRIEASPNLRDWTAVSTNDTVTRSFLETGSHLQPPVIFIDHQSANTPRRFYRAALIE